MTIFDKTKNENRAAAMVVQALGADRWERRDHGAGDGFRDFDIYLNDGTIEPLEVTSNADEHIVRSAARLSGGQDWIPANVSRTWRINGQRTSLNADGTAAAFDLRAFVKVVVPLVEWLDGRGSTEFDVGYGLPEVWSARPDFDQTAAQLRELGVHDGRAESLGSRPGLWIALGWGGYYGGGTLPKALEVIAARDDNRAKLRPRAEAPRRHLFVSITAEATDMAYPALTTMIDGRMDDLVPPPQLPPEITTVWAATPDAGFYISPPGPWIPFRYDDAEN